MCEKSQAGATLDADNIYLAIEKAETECAAGECFDAKEALSLLREKNELVDLPSLYPVKVKLKFDWRYELMKRFFLIAIAFILLFTSACMGPNDASNLVDEPAQGYRLFSSALPETFVSCSVQLYSSHGTYMAGKNPNGKIVHGLYENEVFQEFPLDFETKYVYAACETESGITVLCGEKPLSVFDWLSQHLENPDAKEKLCSLSLLVYNWEGKEIQHIELAGENLEIGADFFSMCYLNGKYYLLSAYQLVQLDINTNTQKGINLYKNILGNDAQGVFVGLATKDDDIYVCTSHSNDGTPRTELGFFGGMSIAKLDENNFSFQLVFQRDDFYPLGMGTDCHNNILLFDDVGLYTVLPNEADMKAVFSWSEAGIYSISYNGVSSHTDKQFNFSGREMNSCVNISYADVDDKRTELILLCQDITASLASLVEEYNLSSKEYYITLIASSYNNLEQVKLMSGETPDMFFFTEQQFFNDINPKKLFEDLTPRINSEASSGGSMLTKSVQNALTRDGALYVLPFDYLIWTMRTPLKIGDTEDYSMTELVSQLKEYDSAANIFQPAWSRDALWDWLSGLCVEAFVDAPSGTCSFNSAQYIELLQACTLLPENSLGEWDENVLLSVEQVGTLLRVNAFDRLYGENYRFVGCPTAGLSSGSAFDIQSCFAMSCSGDYKEGVWDFFCFVMSPSVINLRDVSEHLCIPASQAQLNAIINAALNDGYDMYNSYNKDYKSITISDYSAQQLISLINRTETVLNNYPELLNIMRTEAEKFFSGEKTAEEVAFSTQSRASIFMVEQFG